MRFGIDYDGFHLFVSAFAHELRIEAIGRRMFVSPNHDHRQDGQKILSRLREHVFGTRGVVLIEFLFHEALANESGEPLAQHTRRDQEILLKFVEVREPLAEVAKDQKAPVIADFIDCAGDGAKVCAVIFFHKFFNGRGFHSFATTANVVHTF